MQPLKTTRLCCMTLAVITGVQLAGFDRTCECSYTLHCTKWTQNKRPCDWRWLISCNWDRVISCPWEVLHSSAPSYAGSSGKGQCVAQQLSPMLPISYGQAVQ